MNNFARSDPPGQVAFPVASAGYFFIFAAAFSTAVFAFLGFTVLALAGLVVTLFICYFFRDPDRVIPADPGIIVSPADGKVIRADRVNSSPFSENPCIQISIFMSIFNVHVNRVPHEGSVKQIRYSPGKFYFANRNRASGHNENNAVRIETEGGRSISMVQVAGFIARRIICIIQEAETVRRGQRFGMICFGSRLDVYLPADSKVRVQKGDKVKAGFSVLGELK